MIISRRDIMRLLASAVMAPSLANAAGVDTPKRFVFANNSPYDSLDPHTVFDAARAGVRLNLYDGLYRYVDNPPKLIPWLAESHSVSADGRSYTFKLRSDAVFHDGSSVKAQDVVFSIERILALKQGSSSLYRDAVLPGTTVAQDERTVTFNLVAPSPIFLSTVPDIAIVNSALVKKNETNGDWGEAWLARKEAGSGSFELINFDPAVGWTAKRFEKHFMPFGKNPLEEIEIRNVLETNTRVLGLMRGDFHGTDGYMPYEQVQRLRKAENLQILEEEAMRVFLLGINNAAPPLDDVHLRRALAYSFDYDGFINKVLKGSVTRNPGPLPGTMWGSARDIRAYEYDLEKAAAELKLVKAPLRPLSICALAGFSESEQAAVLLQSALTKIGVETSLTVQPWPVINKRLEKLETRPDILPVWRSAFYLDPNSWVGEGFGRRYEGQRSIAYYRNPEFDELLDRALASSDQAERQVLYEEMTRMITNDAASLFVYNTRWYGPYSKLFSGVRYSPLNYGLDFRWVSTVT